MAGYVTYHDVRRRGEATASPSSIRTRGRAMHVAGVLAAILIVIGVGLIAYPYASDYANRVAQSRISNAQTAVVSQTSGDDLTAELDRARDFNERLLAGRVVVTDPFDPANTTPTDEEYESVLNLADDGVMGTISIPKIDVYLPIYHGVEGEELEHGVGHMPSTTLPVGGPSTHAALAGHTGLPSARIFDSLEKLQAGDWFVITVLGEDLAYEVTSTEVVLPDETASLHVVEGEDLVTLVTCTPYGVNTHRLLVHARRCDVPQEWLDRGNAPTTVPLVTQDVVGTPKFIFTAIGIAASLALLVVLALLSRRHRRRAGQLGAGGTATTSAGQVPTIATPTPMRGAAPAPRVRPTTVTTGQRAYPTTSAPRGSEAVGRKTTLRDLPGFDDAPLGGPEAPLGHGPEGQTRRGKHFRA